MTSGIEFKRNYCAVLLNQKNEEQMKKVLLAITCLIFTTITFSQDNPRPTKSRFWKTKQSTFQVKAGDILVYSVTDNGEKYDLLVRVKKYGSTINFDYEIPTKANKVNVNIQSAAVDGAGKYTNRFAGGNANYANESSFWLSKRNYEDLAADGETKMDFGEGEQTFVRGNTGILKINYKGKEKILTVYNISAQTGSKRNLVLLTEANNPLIVMMDAGTKMTLKEVR
jgi:hypothetical protein